MNVMIRYIDENALWHQYDWSEKTFGPGFRSGVFRHLEKELVETEQDPDEVTEWADLLILTFDGAMRSGHHPEEIIQAYHDKVEENRLREWPDWRHASPDEPIEHVRD